VATGRLQYLFVEIVILKLSGLFWLCSDWFSTSHLVAAQFVYGTCHLRE
jgi:hypothetical protein